MPKEYILFDTEFTAWEGSLERKWTGPGEFREIVEIGALKVRDFQDIDSFVRLIQPVKNPELSDYFVNLTGITQERVDKEGGTLKKAIQDFYDWTDELPLYAYGWDGTRIRENADLLGIEFPFAHERFFDITEVLNAIGVDASKYYSSTIPEAFGATPPPDAHDALNDARSILIALTAAHEKQLI